MSGALRIAVAGDVDHGKSTLLGRLLHDTGNLPDGKMDEVFAACERRQSDMEWSFLLDAFQAERDQAVTIDTTQIRIGDFIFIDTPGHHEFIRNMMSGATQADAALLIVDAVHGLTCQTRDHIAALQLMGLKQFVVAVNKMDAVNYSEEIFKKISAGIPIKPAQIVPVVAREGENLIKRGDKMRWYGGPAVLEALGGLEPPTRLGGPMRFSVQDVYRIDGRRIIAGRVEHGTLYKGDAMLFSPYNQQARVKTIEVWPENTGKAKAYAGECIGITLDRDIFVERGHIASDTVDAPKLSPVFKTRIFRVQEKPFQPGQNLTARIGLIASGVAVQSVESEQGRVAELVLRARTMLALDSNAHIVLLDDGELVGGGTVNTEGYPDLRRGVQVPPKNIRREDHLIDHNSRAELNGHRGGVFWMTGLSASGKTTIAMAVEKALFERGYRTYVLDGDNIRHGLAADLGFSPEDRAENIRRAGHVAALMADAGLIVITAFISPYRADREGARAAAGRFHEIYIRADVGTCEARDPKGLYKKARAGKISGFTGIDSPYEPPEKPDLVIDTVNDSVEDCVRRVLEFIETKSALGSSKKEKIFAVH